MSIPKSMKRVAMKSALTSKVQAGEFIVVDNLDFEAIKTKQVATMVNAFEAKKALIITAESNEIVYKSARNIEGVNVIPANNINVYDLLKSGKVIITKDAVSKIEEEVRIMKMTSYDIIRKPVITEKTMNDMAQKQIHFHS